MKTLDEINIMICEMRQELYSLIDRKNNLLDPEVISASQNLDIILNEYNNLVQAN